MRTRLLTAALVLTAAPGVTAQEAAQAGPVIHSAGAVFSVEPSFPTPGGMDYRLAFEMAAPAPAPDQMNVMFNNVARYLNMHAQAGVPRDRLDAAIVVHGPAAWELLDDEAYRARNGVPNPNTGVIRELLGAGVSIVLCGQTAKSRGVDVGQLTEGVEVGLSAMTAFIVLQEEGFRVNPW